MTVCEWSSTPVGIGSSRWLTRTGCRTVLVVAHTMVSLHRLMDVVEYVEEDPRVQIVFTVGPDAFNHGVARRLEDLEAIILPWHQAIREYFDLALAASYGGLNEIHAPLMMMAHGAGHGKIVQMDRSVSPATDLPVYGLDAQRLSHDGRPLADALILSHESELEVLRRQCPEAVEVAMVAGDPCFDRLVASRSMRERYRQALGVDGTQELVVVSSTWGRDGLFGRAPDLLPRIMDELCTMDFRIGALIHPAVWSAHGPRQVRAWLRGCREAGLILLDPSDDWRALLIAADYVFGDHGSVTAYAGALAKPILYLQPRTEVLSWDGSAQQLTIAAAGRLDLASPLEPQVRRVRSVNADAVAGALTSRPGDADTVIRQAMYELLRIPAPGRHRRTTPVPVPVLCGRGAPS